MRDDVIWPQRLTVSKDRSRLEVLFENGRRCELSAEFLRVESPSAEVQGHGPSQKVTLGGKQAVTIRRVEPVGRYAVQIVFSDGHDTGYYSWAWLNRLCGERDGLWRAYLDALEAKGLSRSA
ncbi:MAG: DUF971 domain-containing protein [Hyphomicrobiaceae bacterium]|nr:DUF971 domain-containing protein [Hyphomicrobiaceae bacterium]